MILPCRIHQTRCCVDPLSIALLFVACLLIPVTEAVGQYSTGSTSGSGGASSGKVAPEMTAGVDMGYDDHLLGSNANTGSSGQTSFFARENVILTYNRPMERTVLNLLAVGRFSEF